MATIAENLETALQNVSVALVEMSANPKPTYSVGGRSFSWESYFRMLMDQQKALTEALIVAQGPWQRDIVITS